MGVSFDPPEANKAFADKYGFTFPLVCDTSREIGMAYGAADTIHAGTAKRVGAVVGPDGKIREWSATVNARTWPQEVLGRI